MSVKKIFRTIEQKIQDLLNNYEEHLQEDFDELELETGRIIVPFLKPMVVKTKLGERKLEPRAFILASYCCRVFETFGTDLFYFSDIGELIYGDELTARSTIQNLVKRCDCLSEIGIDLRFHGETILLRLAPEISQ